jgi:hypothetical protein
MTLAASINKTNKHGCIVCGATRLFTGKYLLCECCLCGKDELTSVPCNKGIMYVTSAIVKTFWSLLRKYV